MATLEMAKFGPVTGVGEVAWSSMAVNTSQHKGLTKLNVVAAATVAPTESVSGVTGMVKDQ